jgi:hypothetical protein
MRLPAAISGRCRRGPDPGAPSAVSVRCGVDNIGPANELTVFWFYGFPTAADERVRAEARRRAAAAGDCATDTPALGSWRSGTDPVGLMLCFDDSGNQSWLEWTYTHEGVLATAYARNRASAPLFEWWREISPVLVAPASP